MQYFTKLHLSIITLVLTYFGSLRAEDQVCVSEEQYATMVEQLEALIVSHETTSRSLKSCISQLTTIPTLQLEPLVIIKDRSNRFYIKEPIRGFISWGDLEYEVTTDIKSTILLDTKQELTFDFKPKLMYTSLAIRLPLNESSYKSYVGLGLEFVQFKDVSATISLFEGFLAPTLDVNIISDTSLFIGYPLPMKTNSNRSSFIFGLSTHL